jgi:hypothetical protein
MSGDKPLRRGRQRAQTYLGDEVHDEWHTMSAELAELIESAAFTASWTRPGVALRTVALTLDAGQGR